MGFAEIAPPAGIAEVVPDIARAPAFAEIAAPAAFARWELADVVAPEPADFAPALADLAVDGFVDVADFAPALADLTGLVDVADFADLATAGFADLPAARFAVAGFALRLALAALVFATGAP